MGARTHLLGLREQTFAVAVAPDLHWVCGRWVVVFALLMTGRVTPWISDHRGLQGGDGYRSGTGAGTSGGTWRTVLGAE